MGKDNDKNTTALKTFGAASLEEALLRILGSAPEGQGRFALSRGPTRGAWKSLLYSSPLPQTRPASMSGGAGSRARTGHRATHDAVQLKAPLKTLVLLSRICEARESIAVF